MKVHGIVLAGGRSTRMGTDKARLQVGGTDLILHIVNSIAPFCNGVTVVVPFDEPDRYKDILGHSIPCAVDHYKDKGPISGIHAGLSAMPEEMDYGFVIACDMPRFSEELFHRMKEVAIGSFAWPEAVLCPGQPFHALYRRNTLEIAEKLLQANRLKLLGLAEALHTVYLEPPEEDCFLNLNTPGEYKAYVDQNKC